MPYMSWDYDNGYESGYAKGLSVGRLLGLRDAANTQVPVSPSADQPKNLRPAEKSTTTSTYEPTEAYATDQIPEERRAALGLRPHLPPTMPEDSKPDPRILQSDYPPGFQDQPFLQPDCPVLASFDRLEEVLGRAVLALERYEVAVLRLAQLLEDAATRSDLLRLREDWQEFDWEQHQRDNFPTPYDLPQRPQYDPNVYTDSPHGSASQSPRIGRDRSFLR